MKQRPSETLGSRDLVTALKAAAETTRLRILALLARSELTVKDLTRILDQSQPRISRHLKLLAEAGLVERFRDGSWVFFHVSDRTEGGRLTRRLLETLDRSDPLLMRDQDRVQALMRERDEDAQAYFKAHAADWDRIRSLYAPEAQVEQALLDALGDGPFDLLVDMGTGTGRILELFADRCRRALGYDINQSMLAYAEMRLQTLGVTQAHVRHADILDLPLPDGAADAVVMHQVLHYLSEPALAIDEAARILAPGGRLVIVDFAPHELEFLREEHAHKRLGIAPENLHRWCETAGLDVTAYKELRRLSAEVEPALTVAIYSAAKPKMASTKRQSPSRQPSAEEVLR